MKKRISLLVKDDSGFSLAEVMVAAGLLAVISLGIMKVTENVTKTSKYMTQTLDATQLVHRIQQSLQSKESCRNTLGRAAGAGLNAIAGEDIPSIRSGDDFPGPGEILFQDGQSYGKVRIVDMTIQNITVTDTTSLIPPGAPFGTAAIAVDVKSIEVLLILRKGIRDASPDNDAIDLKTTLGSLQTGKTINLSVFTVAGGNEIVTCNSAQGEYVTASCQALGGTLEGGTCRSITIFDLDGAASDFAATFYGDVTVKANPLTVLSPGAGNLLVSDGNIIAAVGDIAGGGNLQISGTSSLQGAVTAGDGITATAGNITATLGDITATAGNIDATAGNITATAGNITATAGNITATAGNITATAGNITAGGDLQISGASNLQGEVTAQSNVSVAGVLTIDGTIGDCTTTGGCGVTGNRAVTKDWVYSHFSSTFSLAQQQEITEYILGNVTSVWALTNLKNVITDYALPNVVSSLTPGCSAISPASRYVTSISMQTLTATTPDKRNILIDCKSSIGLKKCNQPGNCQQVCSNSTCRSDIGRIKFPQNNSNYSNSNCVDVSGNYNYSNGWRYAKCHSGKVMRGMRNAGSSIVILCCDARVGGTTD